MSLILNLAVKRSSTAVKNDEKEDKKTSTAVELSSALPCSESSASLSSLSLYPLTAPTLVRCSAANSAASAMTAVPLGGLHSGKSRSSKLVSKNKRERTFSNAMELPCMSFSEDLSKQTWRHVENSVVLAWLTTSNSGVSYEALGFSLANQVVDYTSLTAVFDQYRCRLIQAWLVPRIGPAQISASANTGLVTSVVDYDDSTAWSSYSTGLEYANALTAPGAMGHYREWKPHIAFPVYQSGGFNAYGNTDCDVWIDCAYPSAAMYGLKVASEITDSAYVYDLIVRSTWEFRNQR